MALPRAFIRSFKGKAKREELNSDVTNFMITRASTTTEVEMGKAQNYRVPTQITLNPPGGEVGVKRRLLWTFLAERSLNPEEE